MYSILIVLLTIDSVIYLLRLYQLEEWQDPLIVNV